MARIDQQLKFRVPAGLKQELEKAAAENNRSLNAEIIYRLQETLQMDAYQPQENIGSDPIEADLTPTQKRLLKKLLEKLEKDD